MREFEGSIGRTGWSLGSLLLSGVALGALTRGPVRASHDHTSPPTPPLVSFRRRSSIRLRLPGNTISLFTNPSPSTSPSTPGLAGSGAVHHRSEVGLLRQLMALHVRR